MSRDRANGEYRNKFIKYVGATLFMCGWLAGQELGCYYFIGGALFGRINPRKQRLGGGHGGIVS